LGAGEDGADRWGFHDCKRAKVAINPQFDEALDLRGWMARVEGSPQDSATSIGTGESISTNPTNTDPAENGEQEQAWVNWCQAVARFEPWRSFSLVGSAATVVVGFLLQLRFRGGQAKRAEGGRWLRWRRRGGKGACRPVDVSGDRGVRSSIAEILQLP